MGRSVTIPHAILFVALGGALAPGAIAQRGPASVRDSIDARSSAHDAVRRFDQLFQINQLRARITQRFAGLPASICERPIENYCFGPLNGGLPFGSAWAEPASKRFIVARVSNKGANSTQKRNVLSALGRSAARIPGDDWISGLRVWIASEYGDNAPADNAARACRGTPWWCALLQMYTRREMGAYPAADSLLGVALSTMPADVRCLWSDVSRLVADADLRGRYVRMACGERAALEERLWWLSDPLYSLPGNERRTTQFSRAVHLALATLYAVTVEAGTEWSRARIEEVLRAVGARAGARPALAADSTPMPIEERLSRFAARHVRIEPFMSGRGVRMPRRDSATSLIDWNAGEVIIRAGPPVFFEQTLETVQAIHRPLPHISFLPAPRALDAPFRSRTTDWGLMPERPWEWMESPWGPFLDLDAQLARFARGDSTRLVAATDVAHDRRFLDATNAGALALSSGPSATPIVHRAAGRTRFVFSPLVATDSAIASLEIRSSRSVVGRARSGLAPLARSDTLGLSDLLLYEHKDTVAAPTALDGALPRALATTKLRAGTTAGIFWEVYGLRLDERVTFSLSATRISGGGLISRVLGSAADSLPIRLRWEDAPAQGLAIESRAIAVQLSTLDPGRYSLNLMVERTGGGSFRTEREVEIVRR